MQVMASGIVLVLPGCYHYTLGYLERQADGSADTPAFAGFLCG